MFIFKRIKFLLLQIFAAILYADIYLNFSGLSKSTINGEYSLAIFNFIVQVAIMIALSMLLAPKPKQPKKPKPISLEQFDIPTAEEGRPIQVLFGKKYITAPNVVWYGDLKAKKSKKHGQVIAYKYSLGMHMIAGHGNMNALEKIRVGEKVVWSQENVLTDNWSNYIITSDAVTPQGWRAQTFIATSDYTLSHVQLMMWRSSGQTPGIITVSIRATDGSGHPTGSDLCTGTADGDTLIEAPANLGLADWLEFEFTVPIILSSGTKYAIVVRSTDGGGSDGVNWNADDGSGEFVHTTGNNEESSDYGETWTTPVSDLDFLFKCYKKTGDAPNHAITIDKPEIFGGRRKEGGVAGNVDLMFGDITQTQNDYLVARLDNDIPAFRGLFSVILNQVYIGVSAYLKPWSFFLKRVSKQIGGDVQWYKSKAVIRPREAAGDDINAAHIIRECLIDSEWGLGFSADDFNDVAWKYAADVLYDEGFGLSILWDQVASVEDFVDDILSCIAGILYQDLATGKWILSLTREPTDANLLQDSYTSGENNQFGSIYDIDWAAQTFVAGTNYTITSVKLKLVRTGSVTGSIIVSIRDASFVPIGADLCSGTFLASNITQNAGGDWYEILFESGVSLTEGQRYAIVMSVPNGTDPSSIDWRIEYGPGNYYPGCLCTSGDAGETWIKHPYGSPDCMFKTYSQGTLYGVETFDENDIIDVEEFARPSPGEIIDQVVVNFWDKLAHKSRSTEARDIALIEKQGGAIIEKILNYQGICDTALANEVAERELKLASSMLAGMRLKCTRKMSHLKPNDIFKLSWADLNITQMMVRVLNVNYGNLNKNEVNLVCVEDSFLAAETIYGEAPDTLWTDPINDPADITSRKLIEIPYWSLCNNVMSSFSLVTALDDDAGFLYIVAKKPTEDSFDYDILARLSALYNFRDVGIGNNSFTPTGALVADLAMNAEDITITLSDVSDLDSVETNTYAIINNEIIKILSVDSDNNSVEIARGILDTAPAAHSSGDVIYFMSLYFSEIDVEYTNGDTPSVKLLTRTANGSLAEADATIETASALDSRMIRPYLPGNLKFNGESYPQFFSSGAHSNKLAISWNHRDRTDPAQLQSLIKHTDSDNYGPELGVTYTIKLYDAGDVLRQTIPGLSGTSYDLTEANEITWCGSLQGQLRFVITAVRGGYDSYQDYDITIRRSFRGTCDAESNSWGWLVPDMDGRKSSVQNSSAVGSLEVSTSLVGSVGGVSNVASTSMEVTIQLQGSSIETSGGSGDLDVILDPSSLMEFYLTGMSHWGFVYWLGETSYWLAQTFTASDNYDILRVVLKLYRTGLPGNITLSIQELDGADKPDGIDLCSATIDGDNITDDTNGEEIIFTFGSPASLTNGTKYAIVLQAPTVADKYVRWHLDLAAASYAGGNYAGSTDGGSTWTLDTDADFYFKTYK